MEISNEKFLKVATNCIQAQHAHWTECWLRQGGGGAGRWDKKFHIYYQYLLEAAGFHWSKLVNILQTYFQLLSSKMTPFLFLNTLPRSRWWADSSIIAVNDHSSAGIDRCGWLSLQEANNKEEVKIYPFQHPVHLLAFIQGQGKTIHESNRWTWPIIGAHFTHAANFLALVNMCAFSAGWTFHLRLNLLHLQSSTQLQDERAQHSLTPFQDVTQ